MEASKMPSIIFVRSPINAILSAAMDMSRETLKTTAASNMAQSHLKKRHISALRKTHERNSGGSAMSTVTNALCSQQGAPGVSTLGTKRKPCFARNFCREGGKALEGSMVTVDLTGVSLRQP